MFQVTTIAGTMILTPDVVRMTPAREQVIRDFAKTQHGVNCAASIDTHVNGTLKSVDLFGGDELQREAFRKALTAEVLG